MTTLVGASVVLRPLVATDADRVLSILRHPEVAAWWGAYDEARVQSDFFAVVPEQATFMIEHDGAVVGVIQCYEELEPDYKHASIDVSLAGEVLGRGLGADAVRTLARFLISERGHHRLTIDPAASNTRAIRCYQKVGFKAVGVMRSYERGIDGTWHDGLLMDLLAPELT